MGKHFNLEFIMAYILLNEKNEIKHIVKTEEHANALVGNLHYYKELNLFKPLTDQQFNDLNNETKEYDSVNGDTIILKDYFIPLNNKLGPQAKEKADERIQMYITDLQNAAKKFELKNLTSLVQEINNYITVLQNLDTNTMTFPLGKTLIQYVRDNNLGTIVHPLQY